MAKEPTISDHALIRYCERALNFSFEEMRKELLSPTVRGMIEFGATSIKTKHGRFIVRDGCLVTFLTKGMKHNDYKPKPKSD